MDGGRLPRPRRWRSSRGRTRTAFAVAFLVTEAARLRHGQDKAISRPGRRLGRAGKVYQCGRCQSGRTPGTHRADTCARASRQVSALFGPRPLGSRTSAGLVSLPPLHSLTHLLHRFRRSLPLIPTSSNLTRPSMQPAGAPKKNCGPSGKLAGGAATLVAGAPRAARAWRQNIGRCGTHWPRDFVRTEEITARGVACRRRRKH